METAVFAPGPRPSDELCEENDVFEEDQIVPDCSQPASPLRVDSMLQGSTLMALPWKPQVR